LLKTLTSAFVIIQITIDTNQEPVESLKDLFDSAIGSKAASAAADLLRNPNTLSFRFYGGNIDCTILASKKSGRYRLQSSEFIGLTHATDIIVEQLKQYWAPGGLGHSLLKGGSPEVTYSGALPLSEFWTLIDNHFVSMPLLLGTEPALNSFISVAISTSIG
jgi:hypothetical protein